MKTQLGKGALEKAYKGLISRLEKTEKFVLEQAPEICKQMVKEEIIIHGAGLLAGVILLILSTGLIVFASSHQLYDAPPSYRNYQTLNDANGYVGLIILGICGIIAGTAISAHNGMRLLYIKYCPNLFLLREFKKLLK